MSYLALYRAFRPKKFSEIIGQEHIVQTLVNQINTDRVGHAYLFCGARGTGKTTMAKVFSRAINCLNPQNGNPCGECEACKALESPSCLDVIEMDAASNNKVEHVRDLREKVQYPPVAGKYKVYIIDEVHMLTTEAFNALLKTLEEPPKHAVFILATTESHKLPATILSRCLRFDFKLVPTPRIAKFICEIYDKIGKKYQPEAVNLIAKAGEGSVRDALSIADICVSFSENALTYDDVLEVLGTGDREKMEALVSCIFSGDTAGVLTVVDELCMKGKSVSVLNRDLCGVLRDLLIIKTCKNANELLGIPEDKLQELKRIAESTDVHAILRSIEIFSVAENDLKYSTHPKIVFETAAVKAGLPQADYNLDALLSRVSKIEKDIENGIKVQLEKPVIAQEKANNEDTVKRVAESEKPAYKPVIDTKEQEKVEQKPSKEPQTEVDEDLQSLMAEAEKSGFYGDVEEVFFAQSSFVNAKKPIAQEKPLAKERVEQKQSTNENAEAKAEKQRESSNSASSKVSWGVILKKLRADKEIMLWVACQDVSVTQEGDTVIVCAPGENEYSLLSKPENTTKLCNYVVAEGAKNLKLVRDKAQINELSLTDEQTQAVKDFFQGEKIDIED